MQDTKKTRENDSMDVCIGAIVTWEDLIFDIRIWD